MLAALSDLHRRGVAEAVSRRSRTRDGRDATPPHVSTWGVEVLPPQIFEARLAIEPSLAALAAEKRYPEDVAQLRQRVDELESEFAGTNTYGDDLSVHRAIARAARNPLLEQALEDALVHMRSALWTELTQRALRAPDARERHVGEARQILEAIERGDAAGAARVWRKHLIGFRAEMLGRNSGAADLSSEAS